MLADVAVLAGRITQLRGRQQRWPLFTPSHCLPWVVVAVFAAAGSSGLTAG